MCTGGGGGSRSAKKKQPEFKNPPPEVTGRQTGVENAKDTKKATEALKIQRMKEEGTYSPTSVTDTAATEKLSPFARSNKNRRTSSRKPTSNKRSPFAIQ